MIGQALANKTVGKLETGRRMVSLLISPYWPFTNNLIKLWKRLQISRTSVQS